MQFCAHTLITEGLERLLVTLTGRHMLSKFASEHSVHRARVRVAMKLLAGVFGVDLEICIAYCPGNRSGRQPWSGSG